MVAAGRQARPAELDGATRARRNLAEHAQLGAGPEAVRALVRDRRPSALVAPADANAPLPGANSFTEGQAKSRLEANGYSAITELKKDDQGVWRGTAGVSSSSFNWVGPS